MKCLGGWTFVLFLGLWSSVAQATEVLVLGNESMPFCGIVNGKNAGIAVEILNEVTKQGGPRFRYELGLPWKRAQTMVHEKKGAPIAIIPFTRTPSREKNHMWIAELIPHELRLHTFGRSAPLQTIEEAKHLEVSIIRGSAGIPLLIQLGFTRITEVDNAEVNTKLLLKNRTDVLVESQWVDSYIWNKVGGNISELQIGPTLGKTHHIYLAANPSFPINLAQQIQTAMARVRSSGKLDQILDKWR